LPLFQLVLQFTPSTDFDELVRLEDQVIAILGAAAVDGHDMGSNEANIFVFTEDPAAALRACIPAITEAGVLWKLSAGYRALNGEEYLRIWPADDKSPFSVL